MAVALVGSGAVTSTASGSTSFSITLGQATTAGNCLILALAGFASAPTITSITASGNTMSQVDRATNINAGSGNIGFWKLENTGGVTAISGTVGADAWTAIAGEFSGLQATTNNDVVNDTVNNIASGSTWTTHSLTTSQGDGIFGIAYDLNQQGNSLTATGSSVMVATRNNTDGETLGFAYSDQSAGSGSFAVTGGKTNNTNQFSCLAIALKAASGPAATTEQTHFKFRNDDGSETTATDYSVSGQDASVTAPLNTNLRLRVQVDATNDPASTAYQLEYKKSTESNWTAITTGAVGPTIVTRTAAGAGTWAAPGDVFSAQIECWGGGGAGARAAANSTPGGGGKGGDYAKRNSMALTPGTTYNYTIGAAGVSSSAAAGGATTFTADSGTTCVAAGGVTPPVSNTNGATTSNGTSAGDVINAGGNGANGSGTNAGGGGEAGGSDGAGNPGSGSTGGTGGNSDGGAGGAGRTGTNGAGTAGTAPGGGGGGALRVSTTSNNGGAGAAGQVKITYSTSPRIVLALSSNFANGDATTAQLSVPNSHSYTAGLMSESTNAATVDIANNNYTELEWCLQAISPAVNGDVYNLRVTANGTPLNTYTQNPSWTIGTPGGGGTVSHLLALMGVGG